MRTAFLATNVPLRRQEGGQFGWHAQHRVVAGVELGPFGAEPFGRAALVCFARVRRSAAPDHARLPLLRPERISFDRLEAERNRMRRSALDAQARVLGSRSANRRISTSSGLGRSVTPPETEVELAECWRPFRRRTGSAHRQKQGGLSAHASIRRSGTPPCRHSWCRPARHPSNPCRTVTVPLRRPAFRLRYPDASGLCVRRNRRGSARRPDVPRRAVGRYRLPDPTALIGAVHQYVCRHHYASDQNWLRKPP